MQDLSLIVFDDAAARRWEPFALTRPVGELLFGTLTLRARVERILGGRCAGHLAADHLAGFEEPGAPPVLHADGVPADLDRLYILSRFVPDWPDTGVNPSLSPGPLTDRDGRVVGWYAAAGGPGVSREFVLQPQDSAGDGGTVLKGRLLENVWDLLPRNPDQISKDIRALFPDFRSRDLPAGVHGWGDHPIIIDPTARVEPGAVFDASDGPIWIDGNAHVRAFTRLVGPAYVGVGSRVLGGPVESVSIGPVCRVRGELAESVCLGYTNKQHDGHMGHAYLGRWVN
ncbi:MAG: putative sugar nucleotidyl transferase, partial [Gemmatimonadota bacterium]